MKKAWKIILIVLLCLALLTAGVLYWQRDNLRALHMALSYDTQQIAEQMIAQDQELKKQIETYFPDGVRDFTEEEIKQIEEGTATEKQMLSKIISEAAAEKATAASTPQTTPAAEDRAQEIISRYVAQFYAMEGEYIGRIEGLISSALAEYRAKQNGKNNRSLQLSIGAAYAGKITALEGECDGRVEALLSKMSAELDAIGADKTILTTIRSAYKNEKATKRAYYLSKYGIK